MPQRSYAIVLTLMLLCLAMLPAGGCQKKEHRYEERGRRIRVRAPFTKVDIWVPEDDAEDTRVRVRVDD